MKSFPKFPLKTLATIQMGYSFRSRIEPSETGSVAVIQMKDLFSSSVETSNLTKIDRDSPKADHFVKKGDIFFRSRGQDFSSALLTQNLTNTIVSAPLFAIRVNDSSVLLPEYLNWYINQSDTQSYILSHARGTSQLMISKEVLEEMEIILPPLQVQKNLIEIADLAERELQLMWQIAQKRTALIRTQLTKLVQGNTHGN